jgi:hypothetical protein
MKEGYENYIFRHRCLIQTSSVRLYSIIVMIRKSQTIYPVERNKSDSNEQSNNWN